MALLSPREDGMLGELAGVLARRGYDARLITSHRGRPQRERKHGVEVSRSWRPPEGRLRRRRYQAGIAHLPASYLALVRSKPDIAHAAHAPDAAAAAAWSGRSGRPSVFSCMDLATREWLLGRRLRLEFVLRALEGCAAVVAPSHHAAAAMKHSLGVEPRVLAPPVLAPAVRCERSATPTVLGFGDPVVLGAAARAADARLVLGSVTPVAEHGEAWVTASTRTDEGFAWRLAESLAAARPIVAATASAGAELIDSPHVGRTFEAPGLLAGAIGEALVLAGSAGAAAACRAKADELSLERCVDAYEQLYRELLA